MGNLAKNFAEGTEYFKVGSSLLYYSCSYNIQCTMYEHCMLAITILLYIHVHVRTCIYLQHVHMYMYVYMYIVYIMMYNVCVG